MSFFLNHPVVPYRFGTDGQIALFNDLTVYIDLIDQIKDNITFYENYHILDGDRPDVLSQKLYGSPDYHWIFFLLNDHIREQGWPLPDRDLRSYVENTHPNRVVTTTDAINGNFLPGKTVKGAITGVRGEVIKRNLDLGQVVIRSFTIQANGRQANFQVGEAINEETFNGGIIDSTKQIIVHSESIQYNSTDHYENADKEYVDIDPFTQSVPVDATAVSVMDKYVNWNTESRFIKIVREDVLKQIVSEYYRLLKV